MKIENHNIINLSMLSRIFNNILQDKMYKYSNNTIFIDPLYPYINKMVYYYYFRGKEIN